MHMYMYFSVSATEALFSCTSMCLVLSFFNLIFVTMMKPLEVLSNCIWAVRARAAAAVCLLTKPMKIISKTMCFVASFFSLLLEMMTKPFKVLSNCLQSVRARAVLIFQMVTKPMKIVTNAMHIISSRTKPEPVAMNANHSTSVENEYICQKKKGEIIACTIDM